MPAIFSKFSLLAVKIPILFVMMLLVMMGVFLWVMDNYGNQVLLDVAKRQVRQSGEAMVSVLGKRLTIAESVVSSMANVAEVLPPNNKQHHKIIKPIIDHDNSEHFIAGGGIWPEPNLYQKNKKRRSFFWGRNQSNQLEYFDDYNDPNGTGYHNEEWYAPSRLLKPGQFYWSRSYMDPYSHESMVTVTAPMYRDDKFYGATTIDLSLDGMSDLLANESKKFDGYAYALDRNGTFISYPDDSISKKIVMTEAGEPEIQFTNIQDAAQKDSNIPDVTATLLRSENVSRLNKVMNLRAQSLASDSYQINIYEAHRIISTLEDPLKFKTYGDTFIKEFVIEKDHILLKPVIMNVFHVPKTYWKVILVTPMDSVTATSDKITEAVVTGFIYVIVIGLLIGLIAIHIMLIRPINKMYAQVSLNKGGSGVIDGVTSGELGALAKQFNDNNRALIEANTELEQSVVKAEQATVAKTQFLANMSHEIRTPMNGVNGMLDLLQKSQLTEQQQHYAKVAKSSSDSLLVLINDILDFSKIESGKLDIESIDFNIRESLNDFFTSMVHLAEKKDIELVLDLSGLELEWIKGDPGRIRQILTNLVSNAIKFTASGHVLVKIGVKDVNEMGLILYGSVTDSGIGIEKEKLDGLFDSFSQVDASTTREYGGTGLGLSISKQLCELMQGSISVKSKIGKGSRFEFTLTLNKSINQIHRKVSRLLNDKVILVNDNNEFSQRVICQLLRARGAEVETAKDVNEICHYIASNKFDIVIVDIRQIGNRSSIKSDLIEIKIETEKTGTRMLGLTLAISEQTKDDFKRLGCDQIIPKPVTDTSLDLALKNLYSNDSKEINTDIDEELLSNLDRKKSPDDIKILLVEDNLINQEVALGMLEGINLTADVVSNGQEALDKITGGNGHIKYHLVLMDCQMPVMDGYDSTRNIRIHEAKMGLSNIPIIAMTANAMKGDEEKCLAAGMSDYISKPIDQSVLKEKIDKWTDEISPL